MNSSFFLDRVLPKGCSFPGNYGYIPNTLAGDNDPLDVLIITDYAIQSRCHVPCRAIGVLIMSDEKGLDEKIIAVPTVDDTYVHITDISDVSKRTLDEIQLFFKTYKQLENKKWTKVESFKDTEYANSLIRKYALQNEEESPTLVL